MRMRVRERDNIDLHGVPAPRRRGALILIVGLEPWTRAAQDAYRDGAAACRGCGRMRGDPPPRGRRSYCLQCDAMGVDGLVAEGEVELPGEPVGARPAINYPVDRPVYRPNDRLKGGTG